MLRHEKLKEKKIGKKSTTTIIRDWNTALNFNPTQPLAPLKIMSCLQPSSHQHYYYYYKEASTSRDTRFYQPYFACVSALVRKPLERLSASSISFCFMSYKSDPIWCFLLCNFVGFSFVEVAGCKYQQSTKGITLTEN